jgi:hypothetical protein
MPTQSAHSQLSFEPMGTHCLVLGMATSLFASLLPQENKHSQTINRGLTKAMGLDIRSPVVYGAIQTHDKCTFVLHHAG